MLRHLLHLKSLSISRGPELYKLMGDTLLAQELQWLAPCLEELELNCYEAESCFRLPVATSELEVSKPASKKSSSKSKHIVKPELELWNVAEKFPSLKSLILKAPTPTLTFAELKQFPPTLIQLKLKAYGRNKGRLAPMDYGEFFPHLKSLWLGTPRWDWYWLESGQISALPPGLTELSLPTENGFECSMLNQLKSVTKLRATCLVVRESDLPTLRNSALTELENVECFDFYAVGDEEVPNGQTCTNLFDYLPLHLKKLELLDYDLPFFISKNLPETLTWIEVKSIDWTTKSDDDGTPATFPPHLNTLRVAELHADDWEAEHWKLLTAQIGETLKTISVPSLRVSQLPLLPRKLENLEWKSDLGDATWNHPLHMDALTALVVNCEVSPSVIPLLPRTLTKARFYFNAPIKYEYAQDWPQHLLDLTIEVQELLSEFSELQCLPMFVLPPSIVSLNMQGQFGQVRAQDMQSLPRKLESLVLKRLWSWRYKALLDAAKSRNASHLSQFELEKSLLEALPRNLKTLNLDLESLLPESLQYLPPTLEFLETPLTSFGSECMSLIPRQMRRCFFVSCHPLAYDEDISDIPKHCVLLRVAGTRIVEHKREYQDTIVF